MSAQVLQFFRRVPAAPVVRDWTQQELAEFYRVESALLQAGVLLETDRGVSDEGEPWFIFCRGESGDVFIHFARIDGEYVVDGASFEHPARGHDFADLVRRLIDAYPLAKVKERGNTNVFMHPAAMLIALVGAAFFHSNDAKAAESADGKPDVQRRTSLLVTNSLPQMVLPTSQGQYIDHSSQAAAVILSAILTLQEDLFTAATGGGAPTAGLLVEWVSLAAIASVQNAEIHAAPIDVGGSAGMVVPVASAPVVVSHPISVVNTNDATEGASVAIVVALPQAVDASEGASLALPAPPPVLADTTRVVFTSGVGPAPDLDAVDAVLAATGPSSALVQLLMKALPQIEHLPSIILDLIRQGAVVGNFETLPLPTGPGEPVTPVPPTGDAGGPVVGQPDPTVPPVIVPPEGGAPPVVVQPDPTPLPIDNGAPPVVQPGPIQVPTPTTPVVKQAMSDADIEKAIASFISKVEYLKVMIEGKTLILFDEDLLNPFQDMNMSSVTFTFADGSAVSLVGLAHELPSLSFIGHG